MLNFEFSTNQNTLKYTHANTYTHPQTYTHKRFYTSTNIHTHEHTNTHTQTLHKKLQYWDAECWWNNAFLYKLLTGASSIFSKSGGGE